MSTSGKDLVPGSLSMEQQFKLKVVKDQVKGLSLEQAQEYVVEVMRQMMVKDNLVKHLLKNA
ncbi:MAG: NblA/ycf18 family protein [Cyanobacteria bacterium J06627_28]